jgi:hypothetical protein
MNNVCYSTRDWLMLALSIQNSYKESLINKSAGTKTSQSLLRVLAVKKFFPRVPNE